MKKDYIAPSILVIQTKVEHLMGNGGSVVDKNGISVGSIPPASDGDSGGEEGEGGIVWGDAKNNAWSNWDE